MRTKRLYVCALLLVLSLLLTGCFQIEEEIWVNPDGSGKMRLVIGMSEGLLEMGEGQGEGAETPFSTNDVLSDLSQEGQYVKNVTPIEFTKDGMKYVGVEMEVTDMAAYFEEQAQINPEMGLSLTRLENGNLLFKQALTNPAESMAETEQEAEQETSEFSPEFDAQMDAMMASMLSGMNWTVRLHAPNVVSTNGTYDEEQGVIEWKIPLTSLSEGDAPIELSAEIRGKKGIMDYLPMIGVIAAAVLFPVALMALIWKKFSVENA